jgi:hypothetical protein
MGRPVPRDLNRRKTCYIKIKTCYITSMCTLLPQAGMALAIVDPLWHMNDDEGELDHRSCIFG